MLLEDKEGSRWIFSDTLGSKSQKFEWFGPLFPPHSSHNPHSPKFHSAKRMVVVRRQKLKGFAKWCPVSDIKMFDGQSLIFCNKRTQIDKPDWNVRFWPSLNEFLRNTLFQGFSPRLCGLFCRVFLPKNHSLFTLQNSLWSQKLNSKRQSNKVVEMEFPFSKTFENRKTYKLRRLKTTRV